MKLLRVSTWFLGAATLLALAGSASADVHSFHVTLTGGQEVPPVAGGGTGQATVTLDDVTGMVSVSGTYGAMSSNVIAAHIHGPAAPGVNAGILVGLTPSGGTSGTFSGSGTLSGANVTNMLNGLTYLNLHSSTNPGGEARGQISTTVPLMPWHWMVAFVVVALGGGAWLLSRRERALVRA
jgi:hypothetical protein